MDIKLSNQRIYLKMLNEAAAPMLLDYFTRNKAFFQPWMPRKKDYFTLKEQRKVLKSDFELTKKRQLFRFYVFKQGEPNRIIGNIGFSNVIYGILQSCFLGYSLDEKENGNGYITEALQLSIPFIFEEVKLNRIEAHIMPNNTRSIKVIQTLGFEKEGLAKKYLKINDVWEDHVRYALLNSNRD